LNKEKELEALYSRVEELFRGAEAIELDALAGEVEALTKQVEKVGFSKAKKLALDDLFTRLKDILFERHEKTMSGEQSQDTIKALLKDRKKREKEIKLRLETLRKSKGSSSFDFAAALRTDELIEEEKQKLAENAKAIEALEERLD